MHLDPYAFNVSVLTLPLLIFLATGHPAEAISQRPAIVCDRISAVEREGVHGVQASKADKLGRAGVDDGSLIAVQRTTSASLL